MKISVEKALQVCGNNNMYQKLLFLTVALTWFSVDFIAIGFPLLELPPNYNCKINNIWKECTEDEMCKLPKGDYRIDIIYKNMLTDFEVWCEKTLVMLIGVVYTFGIVIGAFLSSKFSDVLGRKPVLLISHILFVCGCVSVIYSPNIYFVLSILFVIGIGCAGGTMVSYLFLQEVLAPNKRSIYGTMTNSAFAIAGIIYFTVFKFSKDWKFLAYMCIGTNIISGLLVLLYFIESPRYLLTKGQSKHFLKSLDHIARKNGKSKEFYIFLNENNHNNEFDFQNKKNSASPEANAQMNNDKSMSLDNTNDNINHTRSFSPGISASTTSTPHLVSPYIFQKDKDDPFLYEKNRGNQSFITPNDSNIKISESDQSEKKEASFSALLKYPSLRWNFLICCYLWFGMAFTYYGISMGLKQNKDQVFTDGYVVYCAEGISYLITCIIISISFFGRVRSIKIMMAITSVATLAYFFVKGNDLAPFDLILLFLARFGITSIFSIMYTYSTEVYPTTIRAKGLGINTLFARMAAILVPVVVELLDPFLIFSVLCIIGFGLSFFIPETFGKELEDEILEEKENENENKKVNESK